MMTSLGEITVAEHMALLRLVSACPHRGRTVDSVPGCACLPTTLCVRDTRVVDVEDCLACQWSAHNNPRAPGAARQ